MLSATARKSTIYLFINTCFDPGPGYHDNPGFHPYYLDGLNSNRLFIGKYCPHRLFAMERSLALMKGVPRFHLISNLSLASE